MLISSSFVSTAAWHTDQINKVSDLATQVFPDTKGGQSHPTGLHESAGNAAHPVPPAKAHIDRKPDTEEKRATPRAESRAETHHNHGRRAHRKVSRTAEQSSNESSKPSSTAPAANDADAPHFLAILNDVLPQDTQSAQHVSDQTSDRDVSSSPQATPSPLAAGAAGTPNTNIQVDGFALQQKLTAAKINLQSTAEMSGAESTPAPSKSEFTVPQDSSLEISKQMTAADMKPALNEKPGERGETAFAMRVSERTTLTAALNLNDVEAAIAASRFDAAGAGGHSNAREHAEPRPGLPAQKEAQTSSTADSAAEQSLPNSLMSAEPSAPQLAGAQDLTARSGNARGTIAINAAIGSATSPSGGAGQQAAPGITAPGTSAANASDSRNAGTAKPGSEVRTTQFLDSQEENTSHVSASVHDISLKLTTKDQSPVQVRLSERAGELHVSVRTPDAGLTRGLRDGLSDLVGHLEHNGYRAESWQPAGNGSSSAQDQAQDSPSHKNPSQQQNSGGSESGSRQQQQSRDHQEPETQTPKWVGELESSLQRSLRSWPPSAAR